MKKKYFALLSFILVFGFFISTQVFAEDYLITKDVYVSGSTFGNAPKFESSIDATENKFKTKLNFDYEWITKNNNEIYNEKLAKVAILLATDMYNDTYVSDENTYGKSEDQVIAKQTSNVEAISLLELEDVEYLKFDESGYSVDNNDVAGVSIGHKEVSIDGEDYEAFVAVLDTTQGATEWLSNFDIGSDTDGYYDMTNSQREDHVFWKHKYNHKGFDVASCKAKTLIDDYILEHKKANHETTLLLCGHSRGGAISNILGSLYEDDDTIKSYTYTFGTPNTVEVGNQISESKVLSYKTIFNHVNNDDFVTIMPNENWGFRRYGKTISLTLSYYTELENLYNVICNLSGSSLYYSPKMHAISGDTTPGLADSIAELVDSREQFFTKQTKTITFVDEASRDDYYNDVYSDCSDLDAFNISKGLDSVTVVEEYYYDAFLELLGKILGNRNDIWALFTLAPKLELVTQTDIPRNSISWKFSLPYCLEDKIYTVQDTMMRNLAGLSTPHQTAAYILISYFRDLNDTQIVFDESYTYTGLEIKPEVEIVDITNEWKNNIDYLSTYENNIEVTENAKINIESTYVFPDDVEQDKFNEKVDGFNLLGSISKLFTISKPKSTSTSTNLKKIDVSDNSNTSKTNTIKNLDNDKQGTVVINSSKVKKGSKVKFEVVPNDGFKVKEVIVQDKSGNILKVLNTEENNYEFIMPNTNINIEVVYEEKTKEEKEIDVINKSLESDEVIISKSEEGKYLNSEVRFIRGYDTGEFKPEKEVSNIELMSMITSLYNNVETSESINLNQGEDYWGEDIIKKAFSLNLIPGDKNNKNYNVNENVTRADLAVVIYNLLKDYDDEKLKDMNCSDIAGKSYEKEVTKLINLGIIKGCEDGLFHGERTLTRAEAVTIINRTLRSLGFKLKLNSLKNTFPDLKESHWAYSEIIFASNK